MLPLSQRRNGAGVAAFAAFINLRQGVLVRRTLDPCLAAPFTDNRTLNTFYFTNIFREADNGTKYYRRQMWDQYEEISPEIIPDILYQTYLYRCVNKRATFEEFGGIPSVEEWLKFKRFMNKWMNDEEKQKKEKFFTSAHINQGENKTVVTIDYVLENGPRMAKKIMSATSLKQVWEVIKTPPHVGDFLSWQITADLCELKLVKLKENFTALGPGAKAGLQRVFSVGHASEHLELTKTLTRLMGAVFNKLGIDFKQFLGRKMSLKAIEHSLCEFDKYYRAVIGKEYSINMCSCIYLYLF